MRLFRGLRRPRREIYGYFDGRRRRRIDPLAAARALWADDEFRPDATPVLAEAGDAEAVDVAVSAVRRVFGVVPKSRLRAGLEREEMLVLMKRFYDYLAAVRKRHQAFADMACVFGVDLAAIERKDYEQFVGLYLNLVRAEFRMANRVRLGADAALAVWGGDGVLPVDWFDAVADTPNEARYLHRRSRAETDVTARRNGRR